MLLSIQITKFFILYMYQLRAFIKFNTHQKFLLYYYGIIIILGLVSLTLCFKFPNMHALRFNRASLLNIGFMLSKNECDYMVMHDIDLLPLNDGLEYRYPAEGPLHISSPELHPLYHYKKFVGGILSMTREQFTRVSDV